MDDKGKGRGMGKEEEGTHKSERISKHLPGSFEGMAQTVITFKQILCS